MAPTEKAVNAKRDRPRGKLLAGVTVTSATRQAGKACLIYLVVAALWILLSGRLLSTYVTSPQALAQLEIYKGWFFVVVTAGLLFWLLRRTLTRGREYEEKLQLFIDHAPVALAMWDRELRYVTVSRRWREDYGLTKPDSRGRLHADALAEIPERGREAIRRALAGETCREDAERFERADGSVHWLRWEARPWFSATGRIGGVVMFTEDITARKQTEEALANTQARLKLALKSGHVGVWSWDVSTGEIDCDEALAGFVGCTREDLAYGGWGFFNACLHPGDRAAVNAAVARALREGPEFVADYRIVRPDGQVLWIAGRASVQRDESGQPVRMIGTCMNVTEAKRLEAALVESQNRFREVVETIREVFWVSDVEKSKIFYVSPGYEQVWGRPCAELYSSSRAWLEAVHPEDRERVLQAALTKQVDGTYDETYRVVRPDSSVRWVHDHAYPVRDASGAVVRIVGSTEDVTDRKKLEEQFLHAQRLEAIGTLASGVAHDLNNILAPMFMIGPLLRAKATDPADVEMLTIIERSAQRGADVVRQLLTFSRGIAGDRGPLQVRHLVKEMVAIMNETFPREIGITNQIPADLPPVEGDATQLHQVLMNLCVNARDAMPDGGKLSIAAREVILSADETRGHSGVLPGKYIVLTIADTGHGIPVELRTRVFEPFFTRKAIGKGTGLGLSTVLGIVKSHGGFVTLESEVGRGSAFHVHLPSAKAAAAALPSLAPIAAASGGGEVVLVVDDEPEVRSAMQHVLERNGYRVLTAADGREGLRVFLLQRERVRAVVTDLMMPEMGGMALVRALRDLSPGLAVLVASGLQEAEQRDSLVALGVTQLLPKPYTPAELLEALERELKNKPAGAS